MAPFILGLSREMRAGLRAVAHQMRRIATKNSGVLGQNRAETSSPASDAISSVVRASRRTTAASPLLSGLSSGEAALSSPLRADQKEGTATEGHKSAEDPNQPKVLGWSVFRDCFRIKVAQE